MLFQEVYNKGKKILKESGNKNFQDENLLIFQNVFNIRRSDFINLKNKHAEDFKVNEFFKKIKTRTEYVPLQYILGYWEFMGNNFKVGPGVLIPRQDTEVLVNRAILELENSKKAKILDLCSGSGVLAITLALKFPDFEVFAVEVSKEAIFFLKENIKLHKVKNINIIKGDLTKNLAELHNQKFNLIISNPPYLNRFDIENLQEEVKKEPKLALYGGEDGLFFYRYILENYRQKLFSNSKICFEVGINQAEEVSKIMKNFNFKEINFDMDINNIKRVISAVFI